MTDDRSCVRQTAPTAARLHEGVKRLMSTPMPDSTVLPVSDWFRVTAEAPGVYRIAEPMHSEGVSAYLVEGERDAAVIDTGLGVGNMLEVVQRLTTRDPIVLQTHGHWDHIGSTWRFARRLIHPREAYTLPRGFPNWMYAPLFSPERLESGELPDDFDIATAAIPACEPTGELVDGDVIDLGGRQLEVIFTPGHSPGGISFLDRANRLLFVGDAVHMGGLWLFLPRSDAAAFRTAVARLAAVADDVDLVYAAHGTSPFPAARLHDMQAAFEEVCAGRTPERLESRDIGFPEPVAVDAHDFGDFTFLLARGRY